MTTIHTTSTVASALRELADVLDSLKAAPAPARKTVTKKTVSVKVPVSQPAKKSDKTKSELGRKEWNRTLTTIARTQPKGSGAYALVLASWDMARDLQAKGATPADALAVILSR